MNKDLVIFTQECHVNDSLCQDNNDTKALSFKKSLDLSTEFDKKAHRALLKRTFSPEQNNQRDTFSPLIKTPNVPQGNYKAPKPYNLNSIQLGSKDSESKKSSFLNTEMMSRLNSNTFPNPPLTSNLMASIPVSGKRDTNSKVLPFEEVDEEQESNSTQNPIILEKMPDYVSEK